MSNFVAINAKIDAMYSKLLSHEDFEPLISTNSFKDTVEFLRSKELFKDLNFGMNINEAESALDTFLYEQLKRLIFYLSGPYRDFLNEYIRVKEYNDIKKALRFLVRDKNKETYEFSLNGKTFDIADMDLKTFVEKCKNSIYYRTLRTYIDEPSDQILFYMEMNLDKLYYTRIIECVKSFSKENKEEFTEIFGRKIDIANIIWIYRGSVNYKLLDEELINFIIFGGKYLNFQTLRELSHLDNIKGFKSILSKTPYDFLFNENGETIANVSVSANRLCYDFACKEFRKTHSNFGHLLSFIVVFEAQLRDIKIFMEAQRLDIGKGKVSDYLVNVRKWNYGSWKNENDECHGTFRWYG